MGLGRGGPFVPSRRQTEVRSLREETGRSRHQRPRRPAAEALGPGRPAVAAGEGAARHTGRDLRRRIRAVRRRDPRHPRPREGGPRPDAGARRRLRPAARRGGLSRQRGRGGADRRRGGGGRRGRDPVRRRLQHRRRPGGRTRRAAAGGLGEPGTDEPGSRHRRTVRAGAHPGGRVRPRHGGTAPGPRLDDGAPPRLVRVVDAGRVDRHPQLRHAVRQVRRHSRHLPRPAHGDARPDPVAAAAAVDVIRPERARDGAGW